MFKEFPVMIIMGQSCSQPKAKKEMFCTMKKQRNQEMFCKRKFLFIVANNEEGNEMVDREVGLATYITGAKNTLLLCMF